MQTIKQQAKKSLWHPVCILLNNGLYYIGTITEVGDKDLTVSTVDKGKHPQETKRRKGDRVQVSSFLGSLFGGGGSAGGLSSMLGGLGGGGGINPLSMLGGLGGGALGGGSAASAGAGTLAGAGASAAGTGGGILSGAGGIMGLVGKFWPIIKMGFGLIRNIIPLFSGLLKRNTNQDDAPDENSHEETNSQENNDDVKAGTDKKNKPKKNIKLKKKKKRK